jgi:hypothetical protein
MVPADHGASQRSRRQTMASWCRLDRLSATDRISIAIAPFCDRRFAHLMPVSNGIVREE